MLICTGGGRFPALLAAAGDQPRQPHDQADAAHGQQGRDGQGHRTAEGEERDAPGLDLCRIRHLEAVGVLGVLAADDVVAAFGQVGHLHALAVGGPGQDDLILAVVQGHRLVQALGAQNGVLHMDGHPQQPVGDRQLAGAQAADPAVRTDDDIVCTVAHPIVAHGLGLLDVVGGVLLQVGQDSGARLVGDQAAGPAGAVVGHHQDGARQLLAVVQLIRDLHHQLGLFHLDLVDRGQSAGLALHFHRQVLFHGGVVVGACRLLDGVCAQIELLALAVALFVALDGVHHLAGGVADGAVQSGDVLSRHHPEGAAAHRQGRIRIAHLDADDVFAGGQADLDHVGVWPVVELGDVKIGVRRGVIALRSIQLVEIIIPVPDLFRQVEGAVLPGGVLPVGDLFGVIGVQLLERALLQGGVVGAVELEADAGFGDGPVGLIVHQLHIDGRLDALVGVHPAAARGGDVFLVVIAVTTTAAPASPAAAPLVIPAIPVVLVIAGRGVFFIAGVVVEDVQAQQRDDKDQDIDQAAHHIGGGLPEIEF